MNGCHLAVKTALICWSKCQQAGTPVAAAALLARVHRSMRHERSSTMLVSEAMSSDVNIANPRQTIREAARMMAEIDAGALPVGENDRLVGRSEERRVGEGGSARRP